METWNFSYNGGWPSIRTKALSLSRATRRIEDYLAFGVESIWIIDPESRTAYTATASGLHPVRTNELTVPETPIRVVLSGLFAELDRA
jgi:Uma2 family endonuclease